jgi:hypothetical protein
MGDLMLFSRWLKMTVLIIAQGWFIYFWAFEMQSWLAFVPLLPALILVKVQSSKIIQKAEAEENGN